MTRKIIYLTLIISLSAVIASGQARQPRTVRDFFMALPAKYFGIECCSDVPRSKRKAVYLKRNLSVEDTARGYLSGGGDGAQDAFVMALFKRPDGSYLIGFYTSGEGGVGDTPWTVFLNYRSGKWTDISRTLVANYNKTKYIYVLPRHGTTVGVFATDENAEGYKGKKLHDLLWKNGRFVRK